MAKATALPVVAPGETATRTRRATGPEERCSAADVFHDYILDRYEPRSPFEGRLRSVALLHESFALAGVEEEGRALVDLVRSRLGPFRTIWGVKLKDGAIAGWELYFYDFERVHADLSVAKVVDLLAPNVKVDASEPWLTPWHMLSVEVGLPQLRDGAPAPMDVYVDMRSYKVRGGTWELENVYTFHDPRREIDDVLHRVRASVRFDHRRWSLASIVPPELLVCHRLCVANKRRADAIYASRIPTRAMSRFLRSHGWPADLARWVDEREADLDHLLWDVGLDFRAGEGGIVPTKLGVYGSF